MVPEPNGRVNCFFLSGSKSEVKFSILKRLSVAMVKDLGEQQSGITTTTTLQEVRNCRVQIPVVQELNPERP